MSEAINAAATPTAVSDTSPIDQHADAAFDLDALVDGITGSAKGDDALAEAKTLAGAVDDAVTASVQPMEGATFDEGAKRWRGPDGKFVGESAEPEPEPEPAAEPPTDGAPPTEQPTPETPTSEGAPKAAPFAVHGADPAALASVELEFKVAGKDVRKPLDQVVRMAQSGGYNEQLQAEVKEARELLPQWQHYATQLEQQAREAATVLHAVLTDPTEYVRRAESFEQANTPEAELQRLRAQLQQVQETQRVEQSTAQLVDGASTLILPRFDALVTQYPEVQAEELIRHMEPLIRPYRTHGGMVDPRHLPAVSELLDRVVAPYAQQLHEARTTAKTLQAEQQRSATAAQEAAQQARAEAEKKAQSDVARAKRELARTVAPVGRTQATTAPKPKPTNATQALDLALSDALASVGVT